MHESVTAQGGTSWRDSAIYAPRRLRLEPGHAFATFAGDSGPFLTARGREANASSERRLRFEPVEARALAACAARFAQTASPCSLTASVRRTRRRISRAASGRSFLSRPRAISLRSSPCVASMTIALNRRQSRRPSGLLRRESSRRASSDSGDIQDMRALTVTASIGCGINKALHLKSARFARSETAVALMPACPTTSFRSSSRASPWTAARAEHAPAGAAPLRHTIQRWPVQDAHSDPVAQARCCGPVEPATTHGLPACHGLTRTPDLATAASITD